MRISSEYHIQRFKEKVLPVSCGCHIWLGCNDKDGYGFFRHEGKNLKAHRIAHEIATGEDATGLFILHRCDNPSCVNPAHLFVGTNRDNQLDAVAKGRHRSGTVINFDIAHQVLDLKNSGLAQRKIAAQFGMSEAAVSRIVNGKRWVS